MRSEAVAECPVNELVHRVAGRFPDLAAIDANGERVTYRELAECAAAVAGALRARGGVRGRAVVVRLAPGAGQIAALLGALDAGAYLVCLRPGDKGQRSRAALEEIRPACLIQNEPPDELTRWFLEELNGRVLDGNGRHDGSERHVASPDERAYVTYTSGSTGRPKGIPATHASFAQFVTWFSGAFEMAPGSRVAGWAAPGYDASLCEIFGALAGGATLCPVPDAIRPHPEKLAAWLKREKITIFQTVPSFARMLLEVSPDGPAPTLTHFLLAGEALAGELAQGLRAALPHARLFNLYGPTESILATWYEVTGAERGTVPIGRPIPGRRLLLVDDRDRPCPDAVAGQIVIESPYLTPGYIGREAGAEPSFRPVPGERGRCYRTGDLGLRREDGMLEFHGRRDLQIKFRGTRLELTEIEDAVAADESVAECAVSAVPGADGLVSRLVAFVVPRERDGGVVPPAGRWRAALRARFGKVMPPVSFEVLSHLPRGPGGKVDRGRLQQEHRQLKRRHRDGVRK